RVLRIRRMLGKAWFRDSRKREGNHQRFNDSTRPDRIGSIFAAIMDNDFAMSHPFVIGLLFLAIAGLPPDCFSAQITTEFRGAEAPVAAPKQSPLTGQEQLATFTLPPGFQIELVAAEPDVAKIVTVAFDEAGRMWAITAVEYPVDENENPERARALFAGHGRDRILVFDNP